MSIVVLWTMVATVALSTALFQTFLWFLERSNKAPIFGAIMSLSGCALAVTEMGIAKTNDPAQAQAFLFWTNVAVFTLLLALVWFVRVYVRNDWPWLLYTITVLLTVCMVFNLVLPGNVTFSSISSMEPRTSAWGEVWYQPVGVANPVRFVSEITVFLIIIYVAVATVRSFRAGERRKALVVGGAILFFIVFGGASAALVDNNIIPTPYFISWTFVAIGIALGIELVIQAARTSAVSSQMRKSESRWFTLLENVQLGVVSLSADGVVTYANRFFADMLDYKPGELVSQKIIDLFPDGLQRELTEPLKGTPPAGSWPRAEVSMISALGELKQVQWSIVGLADENGNFDTYLAICDDLTTLRRAEGELRASEQTIERYERAAFLVEIGSSLAHELNQPLSAILSNAQAGKRMLEMDPIPLQELHEIFGDIVDDDSRAGQVIQSMRRLLKTGELKKSTVNLDELISEVRVILDAELINQGIDLEITISDEIPEVIVGRIEIQQVLVNILINAIRALNISKTEDPKISIDVKQIGNSVAVEVLDNGPGIDEKTSSRIFDPFFSTSEDRMGMGLSISARIIELHGGELVCDSQPHRGALFVFTVPIKAN